MTEAGASEGFLPAASPLPFMANEHYRSDEEYFEAYGEAMREEYQAILDAGLYLQLDDPRMVSEWDSLKDMDLAQYRKWMQGRIAHINHALRGLPVERIRYHTCYGVNFGPRVSDLQLEDVLDLLFTIDAGFYSFEAANPRHEHEWTVFRDVALPDGKVLIPGVLDSTTNFIEHPELVAERIGRYARLVGRENVIAGTDCGFGTWVGQAAVDPDIVWAKLASLAEGARLASRELW